MDRRTFAKAGACLAVSALSPGKIVASEVNENTGALVGAPSGCQ